jgi:uncharacterized protein (TIGR03435 family)
MGSRILLLPAAMAVLHAAQPAPKFDVASIKPCQAEESGGGRNGGGAGAPIVSPGRLRLTCYTLDLLIRQAYFVYADGHYHHLGPGEFRIKVENLPVWNNSNAYTIDAKADGPTGQETLMGPMLQALLEDRFQLKVHRETKEVPMYDLVVAKNGPKLKPFDGTCTPVDWSKPPEDPPPPKSAADCRNSATGTRSHWTATWRGIGIDDFIVAAFGGAVSGHPVVNKTGLKGLFDIRLEFAREDIPDAPDAAPSIFDALPEQLGLKLVPSSGPAGVSLVIDRVERPSEN